MRLLITTQTVDTEDPILGFFHGWLIELSKHVEHIHVVCLRKGAYTLPQNITVHSLGKEDRQNRLAYVLTFYKNVWKLRNEYDIVFSHMNPHYIVLAGLFWLITGKRIFLWRNHAKMNMKSRIAAWFSRRVFYTSPYACMRRFRHSMQMPVGIDTELFKPQPEIVREEGTVLFLGRLSPVKRPELMMESTKHVPELRIHVYGDEPGGSHTYGDALRAQSGENTSFFPSLPNYKTPKVYAAHDIYVNLTPEGSMDKTVLEAAACGTLVLVSNRSFQDVLPPECTLAHDRPEDIGAALRTLIHLAPEKKNSYRVTLNQMVLESHSLKKLVNTLISQFAS